MLLHASDISPALFSAAVPGGRNRAPQPDRTCAVPQWRTPRRHAGLTHTETGCAQVVDSSGGLAGTAAAAAALAAQAQLSTALSRDPVLHLLRRATLGPTPGEVAPCRTAGLDAWLEKQLAPATLPDAATDAVLAGYPTLTMSIAQVRAGLK